MKKSELQNIEIPEYPIKLHSLKREVVPIILSALLFLFFSYVGYDGKMYIVAIFCVILFFAFLALLLSYLLNPHKGVTIDAEKIIYLGLFKKKPKEYYWEDIEEVSLCDSVNSIGHHMLNFIVKRSWRCLIILKSRDEFNARIRNEQWIRMFEPIDGYIYIPLSKLRFKNTVLNPKEVFSLIEQAQLGEKNIKCKKITITHEEYYPNHMLTKIIMAFILMALILLLIIAALTLR